MTPRLSLLAFAGAMLLAASGCDRKNEIHIDRPADTPATGTTSSTNPGPAPAPASAASQ